ncbi:hypothetical protein ABFS82_01G057100 [Erythranthe guttata]
MAIKEEGNSEMNWGKCNSVYTNTRTRPYYSRRCKSSLTKFDSLPDELVFEILLLLSPKDIHNGARLVCKKWYETVHTRIFRYEHIHRSTVGILILKSYCEYPFFVAMREGRVEVSKLRYKFGIESTVWSSCNGLILDFDSKKRKALYTLNPATKRRFYLPQFPSQWEDHNYYYSGIAYAEASMEYKVVRTYYSCSKRNCVILTVGVDESWRSVDAEHLSDAARKSLRDIPLTTDGFVHWFGRNDVVTLNVETEFLTENAVPRGYGEGLKYYLSMGSSLTSVVACSEYSWEVFELILETGEWRKMYTIDLARQRCKIERFVGECCGTLVRPSNVVLKPRGWLNEEVLVFHVYPSRVCVLYGVCTRETDFFELDSDSYYYCFEVHRNRF